MVSAHLVVAGAVHARAHDRVRDLPDAVVRAMTFDVGVVDVAPSWRYGLAANRYHMIFVDADRRPERDGTIVAPTMTFEAGAAKYAPGGQTR